MYSLVFSILCFALWSCKGHPWDCYEATNYSPPFMKCQDTNAVMGITQKKSNDYVHYFGDDITGPDKCYELSVNYTHDTANRTLYSFTYFSSSYSDSSWRKQCYGRKTPIWIPGDDGTGDSVTSGRIIWPCQSDMDCSLNGKCDTNTGKCACRPAWGSFRCDWLNLEPGNRSWGLNMTDDGLHTNSWGGSVLRDPISGQYHMFEAEIANHCGLKYWNFMSQISSSTPIGDGTNAMAQYQRQQIMFPPFAHEPDATMSNDNEFVVYYSEQTYPNQPICNCTNAESHCDEPNNITFLTYMVYMNATQLNKGEWSKPELIFGARPKDTNFAPVILKNGSLIGFSRTHLSTDPGSIMHFVTASDWKDGSTYVESPNDVFPDIPAKDGTEDPFMYIDGNGYFHSIFHNRNPDNIEIYSGGHGYSMNGVDWVYSGWAWNNTVQYYNETDPTKVYDITWVKRERPHFIFDKDGITPIALTSGLETTNDVTWTGLFPVKT